MDSGVLARVLDDVLAYGGDYRIDRLDVGRAHEDESYARLVVSADTDEALSRLLMRLQAHGVNQVDPGEALRARGGAGRRLPRRLLLHHQPRDAGPARLDVGAGRAAGDGLRLLVHGEGRSAPCPCPTSRPATGWCAAPAG
jgi:hypothetical protein